MGDSNSSRGVLRFGVFEADLDAGELRKGGTKIRMQEQPFQVLSVLLQGAGALVSREELRQQVWGERTFVEFDHALNTAIKKIRIAIGDDAATPQYIETIPKRGYRFIAPVQKQAVFVVDGTTHAASGRKAVPAWILAVAGCAAGCAGKLGAVDGSRTGKGKRPSNQARDPGGIAL